MPDSRRTSASLLCVVMEFGFVGADVVQSIPLLERCLIKTAEQRSIAGFSPHEAEVTNGDADCNGKDAEPNKIEAPGEQGQNGQKGDKEMIGEST
jgi:hypothetical protein